MKIPDADGLVKNIVTWMSKDKYPMSFGGQDIHNKLTLKQLDELRSAKSDIINNGSFVSLYLIRLAPSDDVDLDTNPMELEAYYNRITKFVAKLAPSFNRMRYTLLFNRLRTNLNANKIDED